MNTLAPQTGTAFALKCDELLTIVDLKGGQVCDLFCFSNENHGEWLSSGRTIDYNDTIYFGKEHVLYSNKSSPMLEILEDSCGKNDFLLSPCSLEMFNQIAGNVQYHPSCFENLASSFNEFGIGEDQIGTTFNIFMNVALESNGKIRVLPPRSEAGDTITLKARMNLIVGLAACSHEESNNGTCKPIGFEIGNRGCDAW